MRPSNSNNLYFTLLGSILISLLIFLQEPAEIRYSQAATIPFKWANLQADTISRFDSLSGQVVFQMKTPKGPPLFYAQDISTDVCFDHKCRPMNLTIYWNITGRYLGYRLPESEFLSRTDHEPFTKADYIHLNALLSDPHLPFDGLSFEDLIQPSPIRVDRVDGISGATSDSVLDYVVKGAAYTTYTLWNIVYGPMQAIVRRLTEQEMTPELLTFVLRSTSSEDKLWGLDIIDGGKTLDPGIEDALMEIIDDEDFSVAYSAIKTVKLFKILNINSLLSG